MTIAFGDNGGGPYSPGLVVGDLVFLSGQIGVVPSSGDLAGSDIATQTNQTLHNMEALLGERDLNLSDVVAITIHLTDITNWPAMNTEYMKHFAEDSALPTRTAIAVSALPLEGALVEMTAVAWAGPTGS